jgi:F-type H+-transporting ATPase subunit epsilon
MSLPTHLALEIVTPERPLVRETVAEVALPGTEGELGETKHYVAVSQGFAEVLPDRVTVLAQGAERAEDIDVARAEAAKQRAELRLTKPGPDTDLELARDALAKATVRLQAAARARARA